MSTPTRPDIDCEMLHPALSVPDVGDRCRRRRRLLHDQARLLDPREPLGDGVASPHTARTLRHIQELKRKQGIDYDSHASYHFMEK